MGVAITGPLLSEPTRTPGTGGTLVVSIVSHGHGDCVQRLLGELASLSAQSITRVVLTLNLPEAEPLPPVSGWPFVLDVVKNPRPRGFGANHNQALARAPEAFVCILNPDVALAGVDPFAVLKHTASLAGVGCAYPAQTDSAGQLQDFERELPSPAALWARRGLGRKEARADWVNGACLVLPQPVWQSLGGFDERYFMYCEDVDLSLRLQQAGWKIARAPVSIIHAGQRASSRQVRHLFWHVASLLRLWRSPAYYRAYQKLRKSTKPKVTIGPS